MRQKLEFKWEQLDQYTFRAQVIGGWLIRHAESNGKHSTSSMSFVPDSEHGWRIIPRLEVPTKSVPEAPY